MSDYRMTTHGSIYLLDPTTPTARAHGNDVFADAQRYGGSIVVESRYAQETVFHLLSDGFTVDLDGRELELS